MNKLKTLRSIEQFDSHLCFPLCCVNFTGFLNYQLTIAVTNQTILHALASTIVLSVSDACWLLCSFLSLKSLEETAS